MFSKISRRKFFTSLSVLVSGAAAGFYFFNKKEKTDIPVPGKITGASAKHGHIIREAMNMQPVTEERTEIVIAGGGIAGLSAARWLSKNSGKKVLLLELEDTVGGNSASGKNKVSQYPLGAHYLPLPNINLTELVDFLHEGEIITGFNEKNEPVFNEYYLCFDPEERLFINGFWQTGLMPQKGISVKDSEEIKRFRELMEYYRKLKGYDGKPAFEIPVDNSSQDKEHLILDSITMKIFLERNNFHSEYLHWYVDYCCRDDYGTTMAETSAWAGIHYFASRRGIAANADTDTVLTWPEGNGFLVKLLDKQFKGEKRNNCVVSSIAEDGDDVLVDYVNTKDGKLHRIRADKCIAATPQFVNRYIVRNKLSAPEMHGSFTYAPWMVATITVKDFNTSGDAPLSWDNVIYKGRSVGYVHATHQEVNGFRDKRVISLYWPLTQGTPAGERKKALEKTHAEWVSDVFDELKGPHRNIKNVIENIDIWVWGHGMIRPVPGFLWGKERKQRQQSVNNKIFFAHSDLGGISIFEEAFYQGIRAAKEVLG